MNNKKLVKDAKTSFSLSLVYKHVNLYFMMLVFGSSEHRQVLVPAQIITRKEAIEGLTAVAVKG
jgi:hypothetical protein